MEEKSVLIDPLQRLEDLKALKGKMQHLEKMKQQITHSTSNMQNEDALLEEFLAEKALLKEEYNSALLTLKAIQNDLAQVESVIQNSMAEQAETKAHIDQILKDEYYPLKEEVDGLRSDLGMPKLPSLQQEQDRSQSNYLEKRRQKWNEESDSGTSAATTTTTTSTSNRIRKRRRGGS